MNVEHTTPARARKRYPQYRKEGRCGGCERWILIAAKQRCQACYQLERLRDQRTRLIRYSSNAKWRAGNPLRNFYHNSKNANGRRKTWLTLDFIQSLFPDRFLAFAAGRCAYCSALVIPSANASLDHIVAGGPEAESNIALACKLCNTSKRRMTTDEYMSRLAADPLFVRHLAEYNEREIIGFLLRWYPVALSDVVEIIRKKVQS